MYYLLPNGAVAEEPYAVVVQAMTREERVKRARFLHSRGFRYETIYQAVRIQGEE